MRPNPKLLCWLVGNLLAFAALAQQTNPPATLVELRQRLADHIGQAKYASAMWGVKIVSLDTGATVFEQNPQKLFSPASNSKLYTVALALDRLGADYRIKTSLYANHIGPVPDKNCTGHSFIVQQGLRHYATREQAEHQVALFKSLFPDTLHYVVPA